MPAALFLSLILQASTPMAMSAPESAACAASPTPVPAPFGGWAQRQPITAGGAAGDHSAFIVPGQGVDVALAPAATVQYPVNPAHVGPASTYGGTITLRIATPGRYRVAVGSTAWFDIVGGGRILRSAGAARAPNCSGIRKMIDFNLARGDYQIEVAGAEDVSIALMVAPV